MLNERSALETMFNDLQREKNELKEHYRKDLAQMEQRQFEIMDRLQRLDDLDRKQAAGIAESTKERLEAFKLPQNFVIKSLKRPEKKKITVITEKEVAAAIEEVKQQPQPEPQPEPQEEPQPQNPGFTIAEKLAAKLEPSEPEKGVYTGVKEFTRNGQNIKVYQCFYECVSVRCGHKGKRFIAQQDIETFCHSCGRSLRIRPATSAGFPNQDSFNNFFIAGSRRSEEEIAAAYAAPAERIDKVLAEYTKERQAQEAAKAKTPSKPRRGRPAGTKNKKLGTAAPAAKKSKPDKLADKAPAAQTEKPQQVTAKGRGEELIAALELILEQKGPLNAAGLEKEVKNQFGWVWANFYEPLKSALEKHPNKIFKDGRKYYYDPIKSEAKINGNGQNDLQQKKASI